ncbi:MAG: hypothetical protein HN732_19640 [Rhodospirillaceae bacterium]|mgnify:FL=1|jgi:hypothetical protein|nr:hypothetical protein [Rhodospirillaceae bacterium]MBT7759552.1 hypothetical protein [Rhodospirillaceae bacterium]
MLWATSAGCRLMNLSPPVVINGCSNANKRPASLKVGPMNGGMNAAPELADPIIELIEEFGGDDVIDDFVSHLISLSDVVKNDMRKFLEWDNNTIHSKLLALIESGLDKNGRYRKRPIEEMGERHKKYSLSYIDSQCLLTEWLNIYRLLRAYCHISRRATKAQAQA